MRELPLQDVADPVDRCEMCGRDINTQEDDSNTAELIRFLVQLWVEHVNAPSFMLARMAFPAWSFEQLAKAMGIPKCQVRRISEWLDKSHPELKAVYRIYDGRSEAQQRRRIREHRIKCAREAAK